MEHNEHTPSQRDSFETGSTNPPKKHGGIVAAVLIMVIFMAGFLRALSLLNIGLFPPAPGNGTDILSPETALCAAGLPDPGFSGEPVSPLEQRLNQHPGGILVGTVTPGSSAAQCGVAAGDVLVQLDGQYVLSEEAFCRILGAHAPGETLSAVFCRSGSSFTCELTLTAPNN